ncbi:MAG: hypothetical protein GF344_10855 [Chitinivibrionales bacterium]|nr:hypothetical protein [Chitinivibrionales bacterium]MBD3357303.1 hypothetical protein [Chitinivibrionales bacterium]
MRRRVVSANELRGQSPDQLLASITDFIYNNDIKDEQNLATPFEGKALAEGLERFVWLCPQCDHEDRLVTEGNTISCRACGSSWSIDPHCRFTSAGSSISEIGDLYDWASWHKRQVIEKLARTDSRTILATGERALLQIEDDEGNFIDHGYGSLSLTKEKLVFTPTMSGSLLQLPVARTDSFVFERKDIFECRCDGTLYRFVFSGRSPMKWVYYYRYLHNYQIHERNRFIR